MGRLGVRCGAADHLDNLEHGEVVEDRVRVELAHLAEEGLGRIRVGRIRVRFAVVLRQQRQQLTLLLDEERVDGRDAMVELLLKFGLCRVVLTWSEELLDELLECLRPMTVDKGERGVMAKA